MDFSYAKSNGDAFIFYIFSNLALIFIAFLGGLLIFVTNKEFVLLKTEVFHPFYCLTLSIWILYKKNQTQNYVYRMHAFLSFVLGYLGTPLIGLIFTVSLLTRETKNLDKSRQESHLVQVADVWMENKMLDESKFNYKYWYLALALQNLSLLMVYKIFSEGWDYASFLKALFTESQYSGHSYPLVAITGEFFGSLLVVLFFALVASLPFFILYYLAKRTWNNNIFFWIFNTATLFGWAFLITPLLIF
jgi:hypothetical protein